jgi:hypothetical protein
MTPIAFLYNHEGTHQVRHSAAVIPHLVAKADVTVLATSDALIEAVRNVCGPEAAQRCKFVKLEVPAWHKPFGGALDNLLPFTRLDQLFTNRDRFRRFDALVVTEGTSLFLKKFDGLEKLKVIRIDHGAGDRSIGFTRSFSGNDLVLLPGAKQRDRFLELGYLKPEQIAVVGYAKFDTVDVAAGRKRKFFQNDKPTVVYNPHPEPLLSSWYDMGLDVLEYFYRSGDYNVIFAPHVMLFQRRLHLSVERLRARYCGDLPEKYRQCPHILIDTGSTASVDMSYTLAADIYLGDASSQVYEFLIAPRPCIFLNSHQARWQNDPNYAFWNFGMVVDSISGLEAALRTAATDHARYRPVQEEAFQRTFDLQSVPSSQRAAAAIARFLAI